MTARNPRRWFCVLALAALASSAWAGGVRILERPDVPPFLAIQPAVDVALPGETLLVGQGTYAGFSVSAKSLTVLGEGAGQCTISGLVTIENLPISGTALLAGLRINAPSSTSGAKPGLRLSSNAGHVRIEECTIFGGRVTGGPLDAGAGAEVFACPQVVFVGCTLTGSDVGFCSNCTIMPTPGGDGITAINSAVALYDCTLQGGRGSDATQPSGGSGGHGYFASSWGVVASGCTLKGGVGGGADDELCFPPGDGGDGLRFANAQAHLLDSSFVAGNSGPFGLCGPGAPGQPITNQGGVLDLLAGARRKFTAPAVAADDAPFSATLVGEAGDRVFVIGARKPYFLFVKLAHGTWCVPLPVFLTSVPFAVLSTSGPTNLSLPVANLHGPEASKLLFYQLLIVDAAGQQYLSSPQHVLVLDRDALPDCNGNGSSDFVDTIVDSVPDVNDDFIPDTCGGWPTEHWVDASAPPGGDGSSAMPFQNIRAALDVSLSGYSVMVRDGAYTGALNRDLDFGGRSLLVKSANGPADCVLDCQGLGRAFLIKSPATLAARIEGLTIRNGSALSGAAILADSVSVWDCTFENCATPVAGSNTSGGAITAQRQIDIRRCTFRSNSANSTGPATRGGAIALFPSVSPVAPLHSIQDCVFEDNRASLGGAIYMTTGSGGVTEIDITHCEFRGNQAAFIGGAIYGNFSGGLSLRVNIDDCLFAGNSASSLGGALALDRLGSTPGDMWITSSTFSDNTTGGFGGALSFQRAVTASVQNCVLWGDSAASGGNEIALHAAGSPSVTVASCDVHGGQAGVEWTAGTLTWGAGNLDIDPVFADPDGPDNDVLTFGDNDYALALASPCIDAGDNNLITADFLDIDGDGNTSEPVPLDLLLHARRVDVPSVPDTGNGVAPLIDMGAFEHP